MTFAEFMDLALYAPGVGYYARAAQRSGRTGDFFTSVDIGSLFGELLAVQFADMGHVLRSPRSPSLAIAAEGRPAKGAGLDIPQRPLQDSPQEPYSGPIDLVEAGAGNGRLTRDVLDAWRQQDPPGYESLRVFLVERSAAARDVHRGSLGPHAPKLAGSTDEMPGPIHGIIYANELLDALPTHVVTMTDAGLREVIVDLDGDRLVERDAPLSTDELEDYLGRLGVTLRPGWRVEINLAAAAWVTEAVNRLTRGFLMIVDYGHEAPALYNAGHARGTLTTFQQHRIEIEPRGSRPPPWLIDPGTCDMTSHVDLTTVRRAAEAAGATTLGVLDQTYFVMALGIERGLFDEVGDTPQDQSAEPVGQGFSPGILKRRLAFKTLVQPGGLGSTHKVLLFGKNVGTPSLIGCSYRMRLT